MELVIRRLAAGFFASLSVDALPRLRYGYDEGAPFVDLSSAGELELDFYCLRCLRRINFNGLKLILLP